MSSDDSDPEPPKRKIRRVEHSRASTSSGSPIIGPSTRSRVRSHERNLIRSSDSESGSPIISSNSRRKFMRLPSNSDSASSDSPPIRRNVNRVRRLPSESDSDVSDVPLVRRSCRRRRVLSFTEENDGSDRVLQGSSQWETDFSDIENNAKSQSTPKTMPENNIDSDSSDGQSEKCPICLVSFKKQEVGTPESCDHVFCLDCIMEWSKNVNTCPVDRQEYRLVLVREHLNGKVINQIPIEKPVPEQEMVMEIDHTHCEICGSTDNEDRMLLCDGCDLGFHIYCLTPPLESIPTGYWYCNECDDSNSVVDDQIEISEIQYLLDDVDEYVERPSRRTRNVTARLIPRTRRSERVRRRVVNNRRQQNESSSPVNTETVSSSTSRSGRTQRRRNVSSRRRYRTEYVIDETTGETVAVRKRQSERRGRRRRRQRRTSRPSNAKVRIARQLSLNTTGCSSQSSANVTSPSGIDGLRHQAGIPTLHLFGQNNQLDYFSGEDEDYEVGSQLLARRVPNQSDVTAMRRAARRKAVIGLPNPVSSSTDLLGSILNSQEQFHSRNASYSVDSDGKFKIENKDKKYVDVTKQDTTAKQTPYNPNRNNYYNNRYNNYNYSGTNSNYNRRQNNYYNSNNQNYYNNSTPSSSMNYSNSFQRGGSRYDDNDRPQDYTQRTLCASSDMGPQNRREREEEEAGNIQNSESEVDIYSDIETVTTSRPEESDLKPPPTPPEFPSELMGDDDDSEPDMVIDEKNQETAEDSAVSSTVGFMSFPFPPPNFPPPLSVPPIPPTLNFPEEEPAEFSNELHSHLSSNAEPHLRFSTTEGPHTRFQEPLPPPSYSSTEEPHSSMEIQSGAVQSSVLPQRKLIPYDDDDDEDDENSGDGCPNTNIYSKQSVNCSNDLDDDSDDGCPNFSIYSKESKNVALHTDISLPSLGSLPVHQDYQVGEITSSPNIADIPPPPSDGCGNDMYNPEEETELCDDQLNDSVHSDNADQEKKSNISEDEEGEQIEEKENQDDSYEITDNIPQPTELEAEEPENDDQNEDHNEELHQSETENNANQDQVTEDCGYSIEEKLEQMEVDGEDKSGENIEVPELQQELNEDAKDESENNELLENTANDDETTINPKPADEKEEEQEESKKNSSLQDNAAKKTLLKGGVTGGLYSDSEDENVVKKSDRSEITFGISDINDMTEDISEEERSYTPCLDEKRQRQGLEGLDTEMISDDDRNDFDESHEMKTVDDGDALEINAKESELDFTRPEDYEEGEIIDKNKEKKTAEENEEVEKEIEHENEPEKEAEKSKKDDEKGDRKVKKKVKEKVGNRSGDKENEGSKEPFKKLSKSNKERNYRDKDKERGSSPSRLKEKEKSIREKEKEKEKKKEKRKELERYNVRALIAEKPRPLIVKDQFGRDIRQTPSRSRSRSYTPPPRRSLTPTTTEAIPRHRSTSRTHRSLSRTHRSLSKSRRSLSRRHHSTSKERSRKTRRSRNHRSRSKSPKKRPSSKNKKRKRSATRYRRKSRERGERRKKKRVTSRSRRRSRSDERRAREWEMEEWTQPSVTPQDEMQRAGSPSWTPPRLIDNAQALRGENLTVTLNNTSKRKRDKRKGDRRNKENMESRRRRRIIERDRTPPPSKEVFASGDNILVSVSFNNENEVRDVTTKDRRKVEESKKRKERRKRVRQDLSGVKPVAIIDLARSPFREITSPKAVIVLTDSDNEHENDNEHGVEQNMCDTSQQVASPERSINYSTGPKTPPEPQVKFALISKTPQVRAINNPLHEPDDIEPNDIHEELESRLNDNMHNGPSTPPEPPNSPPSSPDAYDPFEPTKSRSPTPEPSENLQTLNINDTTESRIDSLSGADLEKSVNPSAEANKSMTPPLLDIQPADSQSSIQATPENNQLNSPERLGGMNQSIQPTSTSKPVAQTTPFSSVPTSLITSTPISSNLAPSRINILNSTIISAPASSIPQRIVLPNQVKSSPVKISPTKAAIKSTPIKPMPTKNNKSSNKKRTQNSSSLDEIVLDFDSPYSPGSSDYEDLFEPPSEIVTKPVVKNKTKSPSKHLSTFDNLFGSPSYKPSVKPKGKSGKKNVTLTKTKTVGVKLDEDNLKILDELPNSAVEMLVKDKFLKKLNRLERVVEEVKHVLKPHYNKKRISKEEYKDIMRKSVPKICHNKSGEINPTKIQKLVEAYVRKIRHNKKVTSSSSVNPQKV